MISQDRLGGEDFGGCWDLGLGRGHIGIKMDVKSVLAYALSYCPLNLVVLVLDTPAAAAAIPLSGPMDRSICDPDFVSERRRRC